MSEAVRSDVTVLGPIATKTLGGLAVLIMLITTAFSRLLILADYSFLAFPPECTGKNEHLK